jgi:hypothetical protein
MEEKKTPMMLAESPSSEPGNLWGKILEGLT